MTGWLPNESPYMHDRINIQSWFVSLQKKSLFCILGLDFLLFSPSSFDKQKRGRLTRGSTKHRGGFTYQKKTLPCQLAQYAQPQPYLIKTVQRPFVLSRRKYLMSDFSTLTRRFARTIQTNPWGVIAEAPRAEAVTAIPVFCYSQTVDQFWGKFLKHQE